MNATNTRELSKAYGVNTDDWLGREVEFYAGEIEYQGKDQPAVRVRPISPAAATAAPVSGDGVMNDEIPFNSRAASTNG